MNLPLWLLYSYAVRILDRIASDASVFGTEDDSEEPIAPSELAHQFGVRPMPSPAGIIQKQVQELREKRAR